MNISTQTDNPLLAAKLCSTARNKRVTYAFMDNSDVVFLDKKDILLNQLLACERLLKYASEQNDRLTILEEVEELKSALDLLQ